MGKKAYPVIDTDKVYEGRIITVRCDQVRMPAGNVARREVAVTTDAAAIVAIDNKGQVCLIRHYRHPQGGFVWELPAGRLDVENEPALKTAKRELREEVGLVSKSWKRLTTLISSPGFATERIHLFLAQQVKAVKDREELQDEERDIKVEWRLLQKAIDDVMDKKIQDSKTVAGLLMAARYLGK